MSLHHRLIREPKAERDKCQRPRMALCHTAVWQHGGFTAVMGEGCSPVPGGGTAVSMQRASGQGKIFTFSPPRSLSNVVHVGDSKLHKQ